MRVTRRAAARGATMSGLDAALVNEALANRIPGARVTAISVIERFVAQRANVERIRVVSDPGTRVPLPRTMIAKWTTEAATLPEVRSEIATHFAVLRALPDAPSPRCFGAVVRPADRTALLLTQDLTVDHDRPAHPFGVEILEPIVDVIAGMHAFWWQSDVLAPPRFASPMPRPTRMPQAAPIGVIEANAAAIGEPIRSFLAAHDRELSDLERRLLRLLNARWRGLFLERMRGHRSITLIHGDLHLLGNVYRHRETGAVRFIDWADCKPGLGPHDIAYSLISADTEDRKARDTALLRRYHGRLHALGIDTYPWPLCVWDYRFALLTNLLQCVLQDSPHWLRKTSAIAQVWECDRLFVGPVPNA
jgi:hypothetical protein